MIGQTLGHYRVGEQLGRGGMGEVYVADDLNLNRKVALKFLPEAFAADPERMARFEREAKVLASLNHPNIAAIHGLEQAEGKRFIVMELVEGESLAKRLSRGRLPVDETLGICRQIAEGLEAAHEKGVIHRDLKPSNVMIAEGDKVKILDFGLAKALSDETQSVDASQSPTLTEAMTQPGVILGTAAYMSPEQAKGKAVDKRADIWAFGCILYECLTGKKAFEGETVTETLASVLKNEPDWQALPPTTPQNIRFVLRRCLEKEVRRRFRDAADVQIEIEETKNTGEATTPARQRRPWIPWSIAILVAFVALAAAFRYFGSQETAKATRFHISVPPMQNDYSIAVSPDGQWVVFVASAPGSGASLFICEIGSVTPWQIKGTEGAASPFWSPDSRSIAFFAGGRLKRVDVSGGVPRDICGGSGFGGTWNSDGTILFSNYPKLYRVSEAGGESAAIAAPDPSKDEAAHILPHFLPDGRHFLYTVWFSTVSKNGIYVGSLDSGEKKRLLTANSHAAYVEPGYLLFQREGTLFAQPFDAKSLRLTGESGSVADNLLLDNFRLAAFNVSSKGVLICRAAKGPAESQFVWVDRNGKQIGLAGDPGMYLTNFALSPDGKQIAAVKEDPATLNRDIWLLEWARNVPTRITFDPAIEDALIWSPDGLRIAFSAVRNGNADIFEMKASGIGEKTLILGSAKDEWISDWSKDDRYIAYTFGTADSEIYFLPLFGERKPLPLIQSISGQGDARFSFNGKWVAYQSSESGKNQIYVNSFPVADQKRQISDNGGAHPEWREDGKEAYYLSPDGKMMAVDIRGDRKIESSTPRVLFETNLSVDLNKDQYAVTPDGQRFLLLKPLAETRLTPITVILNWTALLKK